MSSQQDISLLTVSQKEVLSHLTQNLNIETPLLQFCEDLKACSTLSLHVTHIREIDLSFLRYSEAAIEKVKPLIASEGVLEVTGTLLLSLTTYHDVLTSFSSPSVLLSDVIGFLVLSAQLIQIVLVNVVQMVVSHNPSDSLEPLKSLWHSLKEFITKLLNLAEKDQSWDQTISMCSHVRQFLCSLASIGRELASIDTKAMVLVYKSALRIISKDSELRASGTLAVLVDAVCHTTSSKLELISQQNSGLSKVLVFLLKLLSKLVSFTSRNEEIHWPPLVEVILAASKGLTSIMYGEEPGDANLGLAVETLINSAIPHETFCVTFYQSAQKTGNLERSLYAVSVVHKCLSESTQYHSHWWSERHLADLTSFLTRCGNHLCLLSLNGKNKTAYEFVLTRLVGMMVTAAGQSFQPVEKLLLTLLMAPALHVNLLATDCWHFISRYSSARLSLDHCCKLLGALHELRLSDRLENRIHQVIVRLVSGMTPNIQMELVKHKNALDSGILAQVPLCKQVQARVEAAALESMKQHLRLIGRDGLSQTEMVHSLKAMARLLFLVSQQEEWVWLSLQAANHLTEILLFNLDSHSLEYCIMLAMGSYSSQRKFHPLLLKLLHALSESFDVRSLSIRIRMLRCLSYLSTLSTAQDKKLVVQLYQRAIASKDLELRLNALESFKSFAKSTPYQELIQEVAARSSEVNERIVNYCSGQFKNLLRNMEPWDIPGFSFNFNSTDSFQPQTKRLRLDPVDTINSLETLVTQIHQSRCQFSSAQRLRLRKISTDLTQLSGDQL